jgi:hypothetical protein
MNQFIHILLIFFISSGLTSCALNRAKSENMLEKRAGYEGKKVEIKCNGAFTAVQKPAKRVKVYVYPHELPKGDYFLGGYIFAEIEKEKVIINGRAK